MKDEIVIALHTQPYLTREQLLETAWQVLESTLSDLVEEGVIELTDMGPSRSHLDQFKLKKVQAAT